jgi:TPP-dependent pyruvate/acetoin dehydrogenase alpha subunit
MLHTMQLSRAFEEKVYEMFMQGKIHGTNTFGHRSGGQSCRGQCRIAEDDWMITPIAGTGISS